MILATKPRSGSSMVAGLFALHGVWVGSQDEATTWNPRGNYESRPIKSLLVQHFGHASKIVDLPEATNRFLDELAQTLIGDGYPGGRWLFKGSGLYSRVFAPLDPIYITIRRARESIVRSVRRMSWVHNKDVQPVLDHQAAVLDSLEADGALRIDSELLVERDYRQIEGVFDACGLRFDADRANEWIDPSLWHFKADERTG